MHQKLQCLVNSFNCSLPRFSLDTLYRYDLYPGCFISENIAGQAKETNTAHTRVVRGGSRSFSLRAHIDRSSTVSTPSQSFKCPSWWRFYLRICFRGIMTEDGNEANHTLALTVYTWKGHRPLLSHCIVQSKSSSCAELWKDWGSAPLPWTPKRQSSVGSPNTTGLCKEKPNEVPSYV